MPLLASENLRLEDNVLLVCSHHLPSEHTFLHLNVHLYKDMNIMAFDLPPITSF